MRKPKTTNAILWTIQALLAALFLFAGVMKLVIPAAQLEAQSPFSAAFLHFIALAEIAGALGLVLPGLTRILPRLTPLAATGLVIIMAGATITSLGSGPVAILPSVAGALAAVVAYGRLRLAPHARRSRAQAFVTARASKPC